jgi:hypothetical protein
MSDVCKILTMYFYPANLRIDIEDGNVRVSNTETMNTCFNCTLDELKRLADAFMNAADSSK